MGVIELLYLSPFLFPLYLLRFTVFGIPFTFLEVFTYALFGLWALQLFLRRDFVWSPLIKYYWLAVAGLLLGATFGVLTVPHYMDLPGGVTLDSQVATLGVWKGWVFAPLLYFVVLTQSLRGKDQVDKLLRLFVFSSALVALAAYFFGLFGSGVTYDFRLSGFFESANYLSLYLVPAFILSLHFFLRRPARPTLPDYLNLGALTVMAHALFFTQSYAAIIGVFAALAFYVGFLIVRHRLGRKKMISGLAILFFTFIILIGTQLNSPKFRQFLDTENRSSTSVRLEIYQVAWNLVREEPLTGVGPGLFQAHYQTRGPEILGRAPMEWNIPHPHNVFLAFWLNAGLFGFISLLVLLFLAHVRFSYPLVALWGMMVHGLFDTPFWKNDLAMIFWLVLGSIVILQIYGTDSPQKRASAKRRSAPAKTKKRAPAKKRSLKK